MASKSPFEVPKQGDQENQSKQQTKDADEERKKLDAFFANLRAPDDWELLPADPNYKNPHVKFYRYRGTVLLNFHLAAGCLEHWAKFRGRPSDVIVASFPKSGTTWVQEIVWRIIHGETGEQSGGGVPMEFRFPLLDMPPAQRMAMKSLHEAPDPRLIKTHLTYDLLPASVHSSGARVIYISRDPRDVCVSYYHFSRMVRYEVYRGSFEQFRDKFLRGEVMNGPYREHVKGYLDRAGLDHVLCLTYEQLHQDRPAVVKQIAKFLGKEITDAAADSIARHTSFGAMKENPGCNFRHWEKAGMVATDEKGDFMRKGKVGDWRNYFTEEEGDAFIKWANEPV